MVCSLNAGWDYRIEDFGDIRARAGVAQLVEHPICNREVAGSSPFAGSRENRSAGSLGFVKRARAVGRVDNGSRL